MPATPKQRFMVVGKLRELEEVKPGKQETVYERLQDMALGGNGGKPRDEHEADARSLHYNGWDNIDFDLVLEELGWGDRKIAKERARRIRRAVAMNPELQSVVEAINAKKQKQD